MQNKLLETYKSLTVFEQRLVQLLSLVSSPLDTYKLSELNSTLVKYLKSYEKL